MKTCKALKKPSTNEYWVWNTEFERWMTSDSPDILKGTTTVEDLRAIGMFPEEAGNDVELTEIVIMEQSEYRKIKPDFLENYPLGLLFDGEEVEVVKDILKEANTHYVLKVKEDRERPSGSQFDIVCPTTTFANAYYHIGAQIGRQVLSKRKGLK